MVFSRCLLAAVSSLALGVAACGGDGQEEATVAPRTPAAEETVPRTVPADVDATTCAQIGGTKKFPGASLSETKRAALVAATDYTDKFGQTQDTVANAFAAAILAECSARGDASYAPLPALRRRADAAADDELLTALLPAVTRQEPDESATTPEPAAHAGLAGRLDDACADRAASRGALARPAGLDAAGARRLGLAMAGLSGAISGLAGTDLAAVRPLRSAVGDIGRAAISLSVAVKFDEDDRAAEKIAELRAARRAALAAAKTFDDGKPLGACMKLLGG